MFTVYLAMSYTEYKLQIKAQRLHNDLGRNWKEERISCAVI